VLAPAETDGPAVSAPAAASTPAPAPARVEADPDRPAMLAPDRRASFAEVAQAVDVATGRPMTEPASPFSEDLIPQRLPKRGRRASRLEVPWVRERPTVSLPPDVGAPASNGVPVPGPLSASPAPLPSRTVGESQANAAPAPSAHGASNPEPESAPASSAGGGERFAFFAAFRAAAEQAREEAGIDDRRGH
jgi:hypothetical protein